jgi:hypothetical protein
MSLSEFSQDSCLKKSRRPKRLAGTLMQQRGRNLSSLVRFPAGFTSQRVSFNLRQFISIQSDEGMALQNAYDMFGFHLSPPPDYASTCLRVKSFSTA